MEQLKYMFRNMPVVTKNLIIINVIVWLAMFLLPQIDINMMKYCSLHYFKSEYFNVAQLVTYMFMHGGFVHLLFNMFALFMFGIAIERVLGSRRFLMFYMVCGIGAGLIQEIVWAFTVDDVIYGMLADVNNMSVLQMKSLLPQLSVSNYDIFVTVGASGAIYGVLLAFGMLFPNQPMYFMFIPVPIKAKWMMLIWIAMELLLGLNSSDGVAHFAHLGGMLFGFLMITYWKMRFKRYGHL